MKETVDWYSMNLPWPHILAIVHFRHAQILHKFQEATLANQQLDNAIMVFRDMDMTCWLEQAEGLRGQIEAGEPWRGFAPYGDGPPNLSIDD